MATPATSTTSAGTPISFAPTAPGQATHPAALAVTVALLAVACIGLWVARRGGYLRRWVGPPPGKAERGVRVVQRLRLGMHSHAYVLEDGTDRWIVVEGRQGVQMTALAPRDAAEAV